MSPRETESSHCVPAAALSKEPPARRPSPTQRGLPRSHYKRKMDKASTVPSWTHRPLNRDHTREQLLINAVFISFLEDGALTST